MLNQILEVAQSPDQLREMLLDQESTAAASQVEAAAADALGEIDNQLSLIDTWETDGRIDPDAAAQARGLANAQRDRLIDNFTQQRDLAANNARYQPIHQERQAQAQAAQLEGQIRSLQAQYPNLDEISVRRELSYQGQGDAIARATAEAQRTHGRYAPQMMQPQSPSDIRNQQALRQVQAAPQIPTQSIGGQPGAMPPPRGLDDLNRQRQSIGLPPIRSR
jgi:hypothetical protein